MLTTVGVLGTAALYLYTLPALRRLPKTKECSLNGVTTLDDAVQCTQRQCCVKTGSSPCFRRT